MDKINCNYKNAAGTSTVRTEIDVHPFKHVGGEGYAGVELICDQKHSDKKNRQMFIIPLTIEAATELHLQLSVALNRGMA